MNMRGLVASALGGGRMVEVVRGLADACVQKRYAAKRGPRAVPSRRR
jgi:hypothetical protein